MSKSKKTAKSTKEEKQAKKPAAKKGLSKETLLKRAANELEGVNAKATHPNGLAPRAIEYILKDHYPWIRVDDFDDKTSQRLEGDEMVQKFKELASNDKDYVLLLAEYHSVMSGVSPYASIVSTDHPIKKIVANRTRSQRSKNLGL